MITGKIKAISISTKKGIPKNNVPTANLIKNHGIEGDAHAGDWHRQVSLLAMESVNKMKEKGLEAIQPGDFAENLTTEFIDIPNLLIGTKVRIGDALLEITQIGKECHHHCAIYQELGDCVMPREGIFAKTLAGGDIAVGDEIEIINEN
ncbi:MAG: MOSC domain-containing protein [Candidatus Kapabacteria bacterium]|jgi:MOSC domain-containing protein YiiM|nr:MOSC domain-containing protein [Candidatus Kapabacteria bacterium]